MREPDAPRTGRRHISNARTGTARMGTARPVKRLMDVVIASSALVVLSPVMAIAALAIRVTMGRPVLFRQLRPGYQGRPFEIIKFRSMRPPIADDGRQLSACERLTPLGAFLRRTSIDELPELWNIVRGEMSLVGPRPLLLEYLPHYSPEQARRHELKPGLTGLAQINGRQLLDWERRFELDVWYVDHWSLGLDLRVLGSTVREVIRGRGIPSPTDGEYDFARTKPS